MFLVGQSRGRRKSTGGISDSGRPRSDANSEYLTVTASAFRYFERSATTPDVKELRREVRDLRLLVADLTLEDRLLKKGMIADGEKRNEITTSNTTRASLTSPRRTFTSEEVKLSCWKEKGSNATLSKPDACNTAARPHNIKPRCARSSLRSCSHQSQVI